MKGIKRRTWGGLFGLPDLATFAFATFIGLFVGAVLFSAIADKMGRRSIFTLSLVWYAIATLVMGTQSDALSICLWRFIAAIGVGAEIVAVDAYLSEMTPKAIRGRAFAISKSIQYCAVPLAAILSTVLARKTVAGLDGWRLMLLVPSIGAVLVWWGRVCRSFSRSAAAKDGMLVVVSCATTIAYFGFSNWLPSLLEARGVSVTKSLAY
jgi:MFS transporter, putative metabolite:H+ symporter